MIGLLFLAFLSAGCSSTTERVLPPPTATVVATQDWPELFSAQSTDVAAVTALILAERQAAIDHNLALLSQLWAEDARIVDGRGNAASADDYIWQGRAALLDRYVVAVFPFTLPPLPSLDATAHIAVTGAEATVKNGNDDWRLVKIGERWWLWELRYSQAE